MTCATYAFVSLVHLASAATDMAARREYWANRPMCLEDGFPPSGRRSLPSGTFPTERNLSVVLPAASWSAQELPTMIARIIIEESLGLHVDFVETSDVLPAYLDLAGCADSYNWECTDWANTLDNPAGHVALGAWYQDMIGDAEYALSEEAGGPGFQVVDDSLMNLGPIGFSVKDTEVLMLDIVQDALNTSGLDLRWGPNLAQGAPFFTPLASINMSLVMYQSCEDWKDYHEILTTHGYSCNASLEGSNPWRKDDGSMPLRPVPGHACPAPPLEGKGVFPGWACVYDGYWASPACQALGPNMDENCIVYSDFGSGFAWAQNVINTWAEFELPILYVWTGPWYAQADIPRDFGTNGNRLLYVWWNPDVSVELEFTGVSTTYPIAPRQIVYPPGWGAPARFSVKMARQELDVTVPQAITMLSRMEFTQQQMEVLHSELASYVSSRVLRFDDNSQEEAYYNVSCEWVRQNRNAGEMRQAGQSPWEEWIIGAADCAPGTTWVPAMVSCAACPPGDTSTSGDPCQPCDAGTYCPTEGTATPLPCSAGSFCPGGTVLPESCDLGFANPLQRGQNRSVCQRCDPGTFSDEAGSTECRTCQAGRFQDESGSTVCDLCDQGTVAVAPRSSACTPCGDGLTTLSFGASSTDDCICREDFFFTGTGCSACPRRFSCPGGSLRPVVDAGFMSLPDDELSLYKCMSPGHCPGGAVGESQCAEGRGGIACSECVEERKAGTTSKCVVCGSGDSIKQVAWFIALAVGAVTFYYTMNGTNPYHPVPNVAYSAGTGMALTFLQIIGVYGTLAMSWPSNVEDSLEGLSFLTLDLSNLLSLDCIVGVTPVRKYAYSIVSFVFVLVLLWAVFGASQVLPKNNLVGIPWERAKTACASGAFLQVGFITMTQVAMTPLMCYRHPNGLRSVLLYPSVICGESDHVTMILFSLVAMAPVSLFLGAVVFVVLVAPRVTAKKASGGEFLTAIRFLIYKYRANCWWFCAVPTCRALALSLLTVVEADDALRQCVLTIAIITAYLVTQVLVQPWKIPMCNHLDAMCSVVHILAFSMTAGILPSDSVQVTQDELGGVMFTFHAVALACLAIFLLAAVAHRGVRGAQARLPGFFSVQRPMLEAPSTKLFAEAFLNMVTQMSGTKTPAEIELNMAEWAAADLMVVKEMNAIVHGTGLMSIEDPSMRRSRIPSGIRLNDDKPQQTRAGHVTVTV